MGKTKAMAVLLMVVLVYQPFSAAAQKPEENKAKLKKQLVMMPAGTIIEVKLLQEGRSKIKGQLMSVADESFEVQTGQLGKVSSKKIAFADVKSVKKSGKLYKVLIIVGVVGMVCVVLAIGFRKLASG